MQNLIFEYGKRNLYDNDKKKSNIQQDFGETSFWEFTNLPININIDVRCVGSQIGHVDPNYWIHDVGDFLENIILSHEQMHTFITICFKTNGLHAISGT